MWTSRSRHLTVQAMLKSAQKAARIIEVGCGHGHFLKELLRRGWKGTFHGFDFHAQGVATTRALMAELNVEGSCTAGDVMDCDLPEADLGLLSAVIVHQHSWAPMVIQLLRSAPVVLMTVDYVVPGDHHKSVWMDAGHFDTWYSKVAMEKEAKALGLALSWSALEAPARRKAGVLVGVSRGRLLG